MNSYLNIFLNEVILTTSKQKYRQAKILVYRYFVST